MVLIEVLVLLVVAALVAWIVLSRSAGRQIEAARWRVVTRTAQDGTLRVAVESPEGGERVVRELPPALEGPELTAELRLAREEAQLQADELNRGIDS